MKMTFSLLLQFLACSEGEERKGTPWATETMNGVAAE